MQAFSAVALSCLTFANADLERVCDADCEAVAEAAVEWSLARVPDADRTRVILDIGTNRGRLSTSIAEIVSQRRAIEEIAGKLGIVAAEKEQNESWGGICADDPGSAACAETVLIDLRSLHIGPAPGMASICPTVWTREWDRERATWSVDILQVDLLLLRTDGGWRVAAAENPWERRQSRLASLPPFSTVDRDCEEDCWEIVTAGLELTLSRFSNPDLSRVFLDTGNGQMWGGSRIIGLSDLETQVEKLSEIASRLGITAVDREKLEGWRACRDDWRSAECRAAAGTSIITVGGPQFGPDGTGMVSIMTATIRTPLIFPGGLESCLAACPFATYGGSTYFRPTPNGWEQIEGVGITVVN